MSIALVAQILVSAGSLASVFLAGRRLDDGTPRFPFAPWVLLGIAHSTFGCYAIWSGQPGFLIMNTGMTTAAVINFRTSWKRRTPRRRRHALNRMPAAAAAESRAS